MTNAAILLLLFILPAGILWLMRRVPALGALGAIALCYLCGLLISLAPIGYDKGLTETVASVLVALAIPLILMSFDLRSVRSLAKNVLVGYGLQIVVTVAVACAAALIAAGRLSHAAEYSGMAIGLYTGGTPNLIAIGSALLDRTGGADVITAANTADVIAGGIWFLVLITLMRPVYRRFLGKNAAPGGAGTPIDGAQIETAQREYDFASIPRDGKSVGKLCGSILLAILALGAGAGLELLINGSLNGSLYIMITVSVLGIVYSFFRPVREVKGSYQVGQYLVLIFSLGLSMSIDMRMLLSSIVPTILYFASIQLAIVLLHLLLCRIFRIDAGTAAITNTAGLYGPPFIAPVAESYGVRELIAPGVICGIVGLVIGNFLGIAFGGLLGLWIA